MTVGVSSPKQSVLQITGAQCAGAGGHALWLVRVPSPPTARKDDCDLPVVPVDALQVVLST